MKFTNKMKIVIFFLERIERKQKQLEKRKQIVLKWKNRAVEVERKRMGFDKFEEKEEK